MLSMRAAVWRGAKKLHLYPRYSCRNVSSAKELENDEFQYPVQLVKADSTLFVWDSVDIKDFVDLDPNCFKPEKKLVYSKPNIKMLKLIHHDHGVMGFSFMKDRNNLWKICNIAVFGHESDNLDARVQMDIIDELNNGPTMPPLLMQPYQFISSTDSWNVYDNLAAQIKEHDEGDVFELIGDSPRSVLSSDGVVQFSFGMNLLNSSGEKKEEFEALATVNSASSAFERKVCSLFLHTTK
jgi:hypothetical protein